MSVFNFGKLTHLLKTLRAPFSFSIIFSSEQVSFLIKQQNSQNTVTTYTNAWTEPQSYVGYKFW